MPLLISRKICRHTKTMLEKTHCRTTSILLYLCTFQLRNTGCLPLSASSTFVYRFMILPAFQNTHQSIFQTPKQKFIKREPQTLQQQCTLLHEDTWEEKTPSCLKQTNEIDCSVYTCLFAKQHLSDYNSPMAYEGTLWWFQVVVRWRCW